MQTTAIGTVANSLPENKIILLTLLSSKRYILFAELCNIFEKHLSWCHKIEFFPWHGHLSSILSDGLMEKNGQKNRLTAVQLASNSC